MKIGILTIPPRINYGGILQAYALQTVLERMGHEVYVIEREIDWHIPWWKKVFLCYPKRFLTKYVLQNKGVRIFIEKHEEKAIPIILKEINRFRTKKLRLFPIKHFSEVGKGHVFDAYIVGSDQVWRPNYFSGDIEDAYLRFDKRPNVKRIAYAASFGTGKWDYSPEQTLACRELAKAFDVISVREKNGVELCRKNLGRDAIWVIDPTLLLAPSDYIDLIRNTSTEDFDGKLMVYILDVTDEKHELVNILSEEKGLTPFNIRINVYDHTLPIDERRQHSVESWLKGIVESEFVITDSYHGVVFSILFNKPFIVIANQERGIDRINSILSMFGLEKHIVNNIDEYHKNAPYNIDWTSINSILEEKRSEAANLLKSVL